MNVLLAELDRTVPPNLIESTVMVFIGAMLIGSAISYAWWSRIRVVLFREDVFLIRDELWDKIRKLDALSDPAYKQMRERFNGCISAASFLSLPQLLRAQLVGDKASSATPVRSSNVAVQAAINESKNKLDSRLVRYILLDRPVSGLFFASVAVLVALTLFTPKAFLKSIVKSWTDSIDPNVLISAGQKERQLERQGRRAHRTLGVLRQSTA